MALGMTRTEMLNRMPSSEYSLWRAFYSMEPFGPRVRDQQLAQISSILATANTKKGKSYSVQDMMMGEVEEKGDPEQLVETVSTITKLMGGRDERDK